MVMPARSPAPCSYPGCRELVLAGVGRCGKHKNLPKDKRRVWQRKTTGSSSARGYGQVWRRLRDHVMRRDVLCQVCLAHGLVVQATAVDHITPKSEGGPDSLQNLQAICLACHTQKTAAEAARGRRRARERRSGF